jgi:hypothetical protein
VAGAGIQTAVCQGDCCVAHGLAHSCSSASALRLLVIAMAGCDNAGAFALSETWEGVATLPRRFNADWDQLACRGGFSQTVNCPRSDRFQALPWPFTKPASLLIRGSNFAHVELAAVFQVQMQVIRTRQMYGRGGFDLLRERVLLAS